MECRRGTVAIAATEDGNQRGRDTAAGRDHHADVECPRRLRAERNPPREQRPRRIELHLAHYEPRSPAPRPILEPSSNTLRAHPEPPTHRRHPPPPTHHP